MTQFDEIVAPLVRAVAEAPDAEQYAVAAEVCDAAIGHDLFTIMRFDAPLWEVERRFTTRPDLYPAGGRKRKRETPWGRQVLGEGTPFLGSGVDAIRWAFDDADTILGMGLNHVLNMPVRLSGRTLGTVNLLRADPGFGETDATRLRIVAGLLAAGLAIAAPLADAGTPETT